MATSYYVNPVFGSDAGPGTIGSPFLTIAKACATVAPDDTIYLRGATYTGSDNVVDSQTFTVNTGTSGHRIYLLGYAGETVTIQPPAFTTAIRFATNAVSYWTISDLIIDMVNTTDARVGSDGIYQSDGTHNIYQRLEVKNSASNGIGFSDHNMDAGYNSILNCHLHHNGMDQTFSNPGYGMYLGTSHNLIDGNDVHDNHGYGLQFNGGSVNNNVVRNNKFHDNFCWYVLGGIGGVTGGGIAVMGSTFVDSNQVYNNLIYNNGWNSGTAGNGILIYARCQNGSFYFNTIYNNNGWGIMAQYEGTGNVADDNILFQNSAGAYHEYAGGTGTVTFGAHNVTVDPSFTNPASGDLSLQAGSAAIAAGVDVGIYVDILGNTRPFGGGYDAGAYQFGSSGGTGVPPGPPPPPPPGPPPGPPPAPPPTIDAGSLVFSNGTGPLVFTSFSGTVLTPPAADPSSTGQGGLVALPSGLLAAVNQSLATGPGVVAGITASQTANAGSAPTSFTATPTTGGSIAPQASRIYYMLSAVVSGVETPLASAYADPTNANNAIALAWASYPSADSFRLYSSLRSDFLQFTMLFSEPTLTRSLPAGTTTYTDLWPGTQAADNIPPAPPASQWVLGLRLNVTYYVFALLASGKYTIQASALTFSITPKSRDEFMAPGQMHASVAWSAFTGATGYRIIRNVSYYSGWSPVFNRQWDVSSMTTTLTDNFDDKTATNASDLIGADTFTMYDWLFNVVGHQQPSGASSIAARVDSVYHLQVDGGQVQVAKRNTSALVVQTWNLGAVGSFGAGNDPVALAVSADGNTAYYAGADETTVHRWNLLTNAAMADFVGTPTATHGVTANSLITLASGDVIIGWGKADGSAGSIKHYDSTATVLDTYTLSKRPMVLTPGLTDTTFWTALFDGTVKEITVSGGAVAHTFSVSAWQPFCVLRAAILSLGAPGATSTPRCWVALKRTIR